MERAERWYRKWGKWSLLVSWAPVIGDALTVLAGTARVPLMTFIVLVGSAKGARYLVLAYSVEAIGLSFR